MAWKTVEPAVYAPVRSLCVRPYPGHPRGCPNYGKKKGCPPAAPLLCDVLDISRPIYAIWNVFDLAAHVARMRARHPEWSQRQLVCCLYWQGTARKALAGELKTFMWEKGHVVLQGYTLADYGDMRGHLGHAVVLCPEACGVNVTETMRRIGVDLEWPPVDVAYQVALSGFRVREE